MAIEIRSHHPLEGFLPYIHKGPVKEVEPTNPTTIILSKAVINDEVPSTEPYFEMSSEADEVWRDVSAVS